MDERAPAIFDGHNDVLNRTFPLGQDPVQAFLEGSNGHIDLPRARKGGLRGGFFAVWLPSPVDLPGLIEEMSKASYDLPMPEPLAFDHATREAMKQVGLLYRMEAAGAVRICTAVDQIEACLALPEGPMAAILHFEGAEAIGPGLDELDVYYRAGLRSLGPVWSRNTIFAEGVPFRFPATPDAGGGLTEAGRGLVKACNRLGIMLDLSHLNEAGFWDVARLSDAPLVATHSNAHALCPHTRNLTEKQLDAIAESDGMVGLNFAGAFLRSDGQMSDDVPLGTMIAHLDYLIERLGEDRVGLGSDFDGAVVPAEVGDAAGLPALLNAMAEHQYGQELIEKICHANWMRVLRKTWKE
jgi:membrane dipeptidase